MNNISKELIQFIEKEISLINEKITGITFLEILKYKIIDKFRDNLKVGNQNIDFQEMENCFENNLRKITFKIIISKSSLIYVKDEIKKNTLFICFGETMKLTLKDAESNKQLNINCIPLTGVVLPQNTKCNLNFNKNSIILELQLQDKQLNIENSKENTI